MGLFSIAGHERFSSKATSDQIERNSQLPLIYGISLVCSITVISVLVRFTARSPEIGSIECPPDLQTLYVRINPGATLNIVGNLEPVGNIPLNIHKNAFVKSIDAFPYGALISPLKQLNPPFAITAAVDIHTRQYLWLIVNQSLEVNSPRSLAVCGIWNQDLLSNGLSFFYAKDIYRGIGVP